MSGEEIEAKRSLAEDRYDATHLELFKILWRVAEDTLADVKSVDQAELSRLLEAHQRAFVVKREAVKAAVQARAHHTDTADSASR
jgi:hypothetical protein